MEYKGLETAEGNISKKIADNTFNVINTPRDTKH